MSGCKHSEVFLVEYAIKVEGKPYEKVGLELRCTLCNATLIKTDERAHNEVFEYIHSNKEKLTSLLNMSGYNGINEHFNIPDKTLQK